MQQKYRWWMILLGITLMGYGCADRTPTATSQAEPSPEQVVQVAKNASNGSAPPEGTLPDELSPSQDALKRLPQVNAGRTNPFGSILPNSLQVRPRAPEGANATSLPVPAPPTILEPTTPVAGAPIAALPAPQTSAAPAAPAPVAPPAAIAPPAQAPVSPPSLASQIRISGIVQIGNQLNVIVEVPNGGGSRPVRVGEDIISGRVRLARVNVAANREPQIVLEEGGVETIRTVDSGV